MWHSPIVQQAPGPQSALEEQSPSLRIPAADTTRQATDNILTALDTAILLIDRCWWTLNAIIAIKEGGRIQNRYFIDDVW